MFCMFCGRKRPGAQSMQCPGCGELFEPEEDADTAASSAPPAHAALPPRLQSDDRNAFSTALVDDDIADSDAQPMSPLQYLARAPSPSYAEPPPPLQPELSGSTDHIDSWDGNRVYCSGPVLMDRAWTGKRPHKECFLVLTDAGLLQWNSRAEFSANAAPAESHSLDALWKLQGWRSLSRGTHYGMFEMQRWATQAGRDANAQAYYIRKIGELLDLKRHASARVEDVDALLCRWRGSEGLLESKYEKKRDKLMNALPFTNSKGFPGLQTLVLDVGQRQEDHAKWSTALRDFFKRQLVHNGNRFQEDGLWYQALCAFEQLFELDTSDVSTCMLLKECHVQCPYDSTALDLDKVEAVQRMPAHSRDSEPTEQMPTCDKIDVHVVCKASVQTPLNLELDLGRALVPSRFSKREMISTNRCCNPLCNVPLDSGYRHHCRFCGRKLCTQHAVRKRELWSCTDCIAFEETTQLALQENSSSCALTASHDLQGYHGSMVSLETPLSSHPLVDSYQHLDTRQKAECQQQWGQQLSARLPPPDGPVFRDAVRFQAQAFGLVLSKADQHFVGMVKAAVCSPGSDAGQFFRVIQILRQRMAAPVKPDCRLAPAGSEWDPCLVELENSITMAVLFKAEGPALKCKPRQYTIGNGEGMVGQVLFHYDQHSDSDTYSGSSQEVYCKFVQGLMLRQRHAYKQLPGAGLLTQSLLQKHEALLAQVRAGQDTGFHTFDALGSVFGWDRELALGDVVKHKGDTGSVLSVQQGRGWQRSNARVLVQFSPTETRSCARSSLTIEREGDRSQHNRRLEWHAADDARWLCDWLALAGSILQDAGELDHAVVDAAGCLWDVFVFLWRHVGHFHVCMQALNTVDGLHNNLAQNAVDGLYTACTLSFSTGSPDFKFIRCLPFQASNVVQRLEWETLRTRHAVSRAFRSELEDVLGMACNCPVDCVSAYIRHAPLLSDLKALLFEFFDTTCDPAPDVSNAIFSAMAQKLVGYEWPTDQQAAAGDAGFVVEVISHHTRLFLTNETCMENVFTNISFVVPNLTMVVDLVVLACPPSPAGMLEHLLRGFVPLWAQRCSDIVSTTDLVLVVKFWSDQLTRFWESSSSTITSRPVAYTLVEDALKQRFGGDVGGIHHPQLFSHLAKMQDVLAQDQRIAALVLKPGTGPMAKAIADIDRPSLRGILVAKPGGLLHVWPATPIAAVGGLFITVVHAVICNFLTEDFQKRGEFSAADHLFDDADLWDAFAHGFHQEIYGGVQLPEGLMAVANLCSLHSKVVASFSALWMSIDEKNVLICKVTAMQEHEHAPHLTSLLGLVYPDSGDSSPHEHVQCLAKQSSERKSSLEKMQQATAHIPGSKLNQQLGVVLACWDHTLTVSSLDTLFIKPDLSKGTLYPPMEAPLPAVLVQNPLFVSWVAFVADGSGHFRRLLSSSASQSDEAKMVDAAGAWMRLYCSIDHLTVTLSQTRTLLPNILDELQMMACSGESIFSQGSFDIAAYSWGYLEDPAKREGWVSKTNRLLLRFQNFCSVFELPAVSGRKSWRGAWQRHQEKPLQVYKRLLECVQQQDGGRQASDCTKACELLGDSEFSDSLQGIQLSWKEWHSTLSGLLAFQTEPQCRSLQETVAVEVLQHHFAELLDEDKPVSFENRVVGESNTWNQYLQWIADAVEVPAILQLVADRVSATYAVAWQDLVNWRCEVRQVLDGWIVALTEPRGSCYTHFAAVCMVWSRQTQQPENQVREEVLQHKNKQLEFVLERRRWLDNFVSALGCVEISALREYCIALGREWSGLTLGEVDHVFGGAGTGRAILWGVEAQDSSGRQQLPSQMVRSPGFVAWLIRAQSSELFKSKCEQARRGPGFRQMTKLVVTQSFDGAGDDSFELELRACFEAAVSWLQLFDTLSANPERCATFVEIQRLQSHLLDPEDQTTPLLASCASCTGTRSDIESVIWSGKTPLGERHEWANALRRDVRNFKQFCITFKVPDADAAWKRTAIWVNVADKPVSCYLQLFQAVGEHARLALGVSTFAEDQTTVGRQSIEAKLTELGLSAEVHAIGGAAGVLPKNRLGPPSLVRSFTAQPRSTAVPLPGSVKPSVSASVPTSLFSLRGLRGTAGAQQTMAAVLVRTTGPDVRFLQQAVVRTLLDECFPAMVDAEQQPTFEELAAQSDLWCAFYDWAEPHSMVELQSSNARVCAHVRGRIQDVYREVFDTVSQQTCTVRRVTLIDEHEHKSSIMAIWSRSEAATPRSGVQLASQAFAANAKLVKERRQILDQVLHCATLIAGSPLDRNARLIVQHWQSLTMADVGDQTKLIALPSGEQAVALPVDLTVEFLGWFRLGIDNSSPLLRHFVAAACKAEAVTHGPTAPLLTSTILADVLVLRHARDSWIAFFKKLSSKTVTVGELDEDCSASGVGNAVAQIARPVTVLEMLLQDPVVVGGFSDLQLLSRAAAANRPVVDPAAWAQTAKDDLGSLQQFLTEVDAVEDIVRILQLSMNFLRAGEGIASVEAMLHSLGTIKEEIKPEARARKPLLDIIGRAFPWPSDLLKQHGHQTIVSTLMGPRASTAKDLLALLCCWCAAGADGKRLLDWLRSLGDDDWDNRMEEARTRDITQGPPELWTEKAKHIATIDSVRSSFFHLLYPESHEPEDELLFQTFPSLLLSAVHDLAAATSGLEDLFAKFNACCGLVRHYEILMGADDEDARKLEAYLDPQKEAQWVIDSSLPLRSRKHTSVLILQVRNVVNGQEALQELGETVLLEFRSRLAIETKTKEKEDAGAANIKHFLDQFSFVRELAGLMVQLSDAGHLEYLSFRYPALGAGPCLIADATSSGQVPVARSAEAVKAEVERAQQTYKAWVAAVREVKTGSEYYYLNFLGMKQVGELAGLLTAASQGGAMGAVKQAALVQLLRCCCRTYRGTPAVLKPRKEEQLLGQGQDVREKLVRCGRWLGRLLRTQPAPQRPLDPRLVVRIKEGDAYNDHADYDDLPRGGVTVMCQAAGEALTTALSLYARVGRLPEHQELVVCGEHTVLEDVLNLVNRWANAEAHGRDKCIFVLVHFEYLVSCTVHTDLPCHKIHLTISPFPCMAELLVSRAAAERN
jgi:hypothetical protein